MIFLCGIPSQVRWAMSKFNPPPHASNHCRYYSYNLQGVRGPSCAKGIDLSAPGAANVCMPRGLNAKGFCQARQEYSAQERDDWKKWQASVLERLAQIMPLIPGDNNPKKDREYWGKTGSFSCPACETGTVRWTRSPPNGHIWAHCSTPYCFKVMQ